MERVEWTYMNDPEGPAKASHDIWFSRLFRLLGWREQGLIEFDGEKCVFLLHCPYNEIDVVGIDLDDIAQMKTNFVRFWERINLMLEDIWKKNHAVAETEKG